MTEQVAPPDLGLESVDVGPGPFTVAALAALDPAGLQEVSLVEVVGLIDEQVAWLASVRAGHLAELVARRGGLSDPDAAAVAALPPDGLRDGREPAFREWERELLSARCGISGFEARQRCQTAVAVAGGRLPMTAHALDTGGTSWAHAVALATETAELTPEQAGLVERRVLADRRAVTPGQYRARARKYAATLTPPPDPAEVRQQRSLTASQNEFGGVQLHAQLTDEGGRIVATALDALADRTGPDDGRLVDERRADALVELCQGFLDAGGIGAVASPRGPGGVRPHLTLQTTPDVLAGASNATVTLDGGAGLGHVEIDPRVARRIACDAGVSLLTHDHGHIFDLGRESRFPSAALRRRLDARDGGCRFPGCTRPAHRCHAHHVIHWAAGGRTDEQNMILVCSRHHQAIHEGGWQLTFTGQTATWTDPHGRRYHGPPPLAEPPPMTDPPTWASTQRHDPGDPDALLVVGDPSFIEPHEPPRMSALPVPTATGSTAQPDPDEPPF